MVRIVIILLFFLSILTINAQEISVKVFADSAVYDVGDHIQLGYRIIHRKNTSIYFPSVKDSIKNIEFIESLPVNIKEEENRKESVYKFIFAGFDSGSVTIPSITIQYKSIADTSFKEIKTDSLTLLINTLPVDVNADIMDIKAPLTIDIDWLFVLLIIVITVVVLLMGYLIFKKYFSSRFRSESIEEEFSKLPHEEALDLLKDLEEKKLWQNGRIKEYHSEITAIVRRYFERRFAILALEMPTSEIIGILNEVSDAKKIIETTERFLQNADMVKFAKFMPLNDVNIEMMDQAYTIIEMTKEDILIESPKEENSNV
jgi:hypothetical protein